MKKLLITGVVAGSLCALPGYAQEVKADKNGLTVRGQDYKLVLGGRVHLDTVSVNDDITQMPDKSDVRRFRIDATLTVAKNFRLKLDYDVGGVSTGWKNAWVEYRGIENMRIKAGQFIVPFNGEDMMSSNDLKLMERALPSALGPNFAVGGAVSYRGDNWSIVGGYFGDPIDQDPIRATDEGESVVGRLVYAPINKRKQAVHLAVALEHRKLNDNEPSKVSAQPEFGLSGVSLIRTGSRPEINAYTNYNVEAGFMRGPFMIKGQYITRQNDAPTLGDPEYSGMVIESAFVLTGERQRYTSSSGTFGGIRPKSKYGAIELAGRISSLDLSDGLVAGGKQTNYSLGANWYLNRNVRLMANYVRAEADPNRSGLPETAEAVMGRFQIAY
jgi:phosphate-selective porin OprO/OprP